MTTTSNITFLPHNDTSTTTHSQPEHELITREPWEDTLTTLANKPGTTVSVPRSKDLKRTQVVNAFLDAFQLMGGTPKLALWGAENPTEFYRLYSKLLPSQSKTETEASGEMTIRHVLPPGPLDN